MWFSNLTLKLKTRASQIYSWLTSEPSTSGLSTPAASSVLSEFSAPEPETVLTTSAPAELSTKEATTMSVSLSTISSALSLIASSVQATEVIYKAGAELIQVAEDAYSSSVGSGLTKKAAVLKALEAFCVSIGENWDALKAEVSSWIDMVIQSWNKLKAMVSVSSAEAQTVEVGTAAHN